MINFSRSDSIHSIISYQFRISSNSHFHFDKCMNFLSTWAYFHIRTRYYCAFPHSIRKNDSHCHFHIFLLRILRNQGLERHSRIFSRSCNFVGENISHETASKYTRKPSSFIITHIENPPQSKTTGHQTRNLIIFEFDICCFRFRAGQRDKALLVS